MQYLVMLLMAPLLSGQPVQTKNLNAAISPLSDFSAEWNDPKYQVCNTAAEATYMSEDERKVIYILNLARFNPKLFCSTVVKKYPKYNDNAGLVNSTYYQSLITTMNSMQKLTLLEPDSDCFVSAQCHAYNTGLTGEEGHQRSDSCRNKLYYNGECISYGQADPLNIVMSLLIDSNVPSLGHRKICFGNFKSIAVAIQPHKRWDTNAVLDFHF